MHRHSILPKIKNEALKAKEKYPRSFQKVAERLIHVLPQATGQMMGHPTRQPNNRRALERKLNIHGNSSTVRGFFISSYTGL